jgi:glucose-6-phosphate isomerase
MYQMRLPLILIMMISHNHHDAFLCSMFAHADELAVASNRPSSLLLSGGLNANRCGQLIASAEHRSIHKAT